MNQMKQIREMLMNELEQNRKLQRIVEKSMKKAPEGCLIVSKSNGITQFFQKTDKMQKKGKYLKKSEEKKIYALAQKDYDIALYNELKKQEVQMEKGLKYLPERELTDVFENLTEARKFYVEPRVISADEYVKQWESEEYESNPFHKENKRFETERGEFVRSKSEKIIADKLYAMRVPYRYEYPLRTERMGTIYPDFTLLCVASRREYYLEHFGMMDNSDYCDKALRRIQELAHEGIVLGKNLFATFESSTVALDIKELEFLKYMQ